MAIAYDMKCSWCDWESEIWKGPNDVISCKNPDKPDCKGIMQNTFKKPPALTRAACPTRQGYNDGVSYSVKGE